MDNQISVPAQRLYFVTYLLVMANLSHSARNVQRSERDQEEEVCVCGYGTLLYPVLCPVLPVYVLVLSAEGDTPRRKRGKQDIQESATCTVSTWTAGGVFLMGVLDLSHAP